MIEPTPTTNDRPRHVPMRTCVGCRAVGPQGDLLRIALTGETPVADPRRRAAGRGVYVHRRPDCLKAAGKGGLARALRRSVSRADLDAIARAAANADDASQGGANAVERAPHLSTSGTIPAIESADRASHGA